MRPTILNQTLSGTAALIAGALSIVTGTSFGDNILAVLPDAIGATIGNAVAGRLARGETARTGADDKRLGTNQGDFAPRAKGIQLASSDGSIGDVTFADVKAAGQRAYDAVADKVDDVRAFFAAKANGASFDAAVEAATEVKNTITVTATRISDSIASVARPYLDSLTNLTNAVTGGLNRAGEVQFRADRAEAAGNRAVLRAVGQSYQQLDNRYQVTTRGLGFIQGVGGLVGAVGSAAAVGSGVALEVPSVGTSTALVVAGGVGFTASIDAARAGFATAVRGQYQPTFVEGSAIALGASPSQAALTSAALQIGGGAAAARAALTAQNVSVVSLRNIGSVEGVPTQLELNKAAGKAFQLQVSRYGNNTLQNFVEEVSIRPNTAIGKANFKIRADGLGTNPNTLVIDLLEAKGSATAPLTKNQALGFPLLEQYGGTIVGTKGGIQYPAGTIINSGSVVNIIRPTDIPKGY